MYGQHRHFAEPGRNLSRGGQAPQGLAAEVRALSRRCAQATLSPRSALWMSSSLPSTRWRPVQDA
ncbi:hypothetical protein A1O3_00577 [Capronia epimyces CBS 606.96]|uniref:Uncharacterized protein n=1 Tax=Capronia epimyces CBS 606.96 TaxID=1182542 RepID=W9YGK6_9EURO|nr:uncharacterized protein A1O3_00577 [Capronia epimyces CBS 606.96]EXJ92027.1 hypothetical protein A1O3_00577 [Capronia epimyces CBS 606.96]